MKVQYIYRSSNNVTLVRRDWGNNKPSWGGDFLVSWGAGPAKLYETDDMEAALFVASMFGAKF